MLHCSHRHDKTNCTSEKMKSECIPPLERCCWLFFMPLNAITKFFLCFEKAEFMSMIIREKEMEQEWLSVKRSTKKTMKPIKPLQWHKRSDPTTAKEERRENFVCRWHFHGRRCFHKLHLFKCFLLLLCCTIWPYFKCAFCKHYSRKYFWMPSSIFSQKSSGTSDFS